MNAVAPQSQGLPASRRQDRACLLLAYYRQLQSLSACCASQPELTRGSAVADGPRDAVCQVKFSQVRYCTTTPQPFTALSPGPPG